ncbi:hypothetical protein MMC28_010193 [Mycoblastus sanguinarius]|nr:hypothetical protein [Mycoblastus sanguinarius]
MAPSNEDVNPQKVQDDARNPFVAFRRFADEQMSSLMNNVFSISSAFTSSPSLMRRSIQDYETWLQEARNSRQHLEQEAEEAGKIMDVYTRAYNESQDIDAGSVQNSTRDDEGPPRCPYRPAGQEVPRLEAYSPGLCRSALSLAAIGTHLPPTVLDAPILDEQLPPITIAYLLQSPYSPLLLERQQPYCDGGIHWREAFEDLLAVQNGRAISTCSHDDSQSNIDWVRRMIHAAISNREDNIKGSSEAFYKTRNSIREPPRLLSRPDGVRQREDDAHRDDDGDDDDDDDDDYEDLNDEDVTELDLYDKFLGAQHPSLAGAANTAARSFAHLQQDSSPSETDGAKPSILSTLTTTERTTLLDGSVHTKVVLKKRFSDGREESTETVHTQNALPKQLNQPKPKMIDSLDKGKNDNGAETDGRKKKGWFWS